MSLRTFARIFLHSQMLPVLEAGEETLVGGQAVMEGVMMRAPHSYCVAVRRANGEVVTQEKPLAKISEQYKIYKYPVFRGVGTLYQSMKLGIKALQFSANIALQDEAQAQNKKKNEEEKPAKEPSGWMMAASLVFPIAFFIFMYKFLPLFLVTKMGDFYPVLQGRLASNFADGVLRILIFLGFLFTVSRLKDMRRVWEYHGAEHKVVFNYESGKPVTVENAQAFTTFHPRCGTSFLLVVMVISMVLYALAPFDGFVAKFVVRLALLPLIIGLSYELIRFAAKRRGSVLAMLTTPGLWLQRITTKPPSDEQTAVAIRALDGAMELEAAQGGELIIA